MPVSHSRFAVLLILLANSLCWAQAPKTEIKIGFSIEAVKGERWETDLDEFQKRAHELGATVVTRSADGDDDLQLRQVKEFVNDGIDVLVFLPHDTSKAGPMIEAAHAKHVPVISYDRLAAAPRPRSISTSDSTCFRWECSKPKAWLRSCRKGTTCC